MLSKGTSFWVLRNWWRLTSTGRLAVLFSVEALSAHLEGRSVGSPNSRPSSLFSGLGKAVCECLSVGLSLCSTASSSDLVCSLLLDTIVRSKGDSLPLTPGSIGCTGWFYCVWVECSFLPQVREWFFLSVVNYLITFIPYPRGLGGWGDSVAVQ